MKITAQMVNEASFKRTLKRWGKLTGEGVEEGIKQITEATGRALASKVQPFGLSAAKGKQYQDSIIEQVKHVRYGANAGAYSGNSIEQAHESARRFGRVKIRHISSNKWEPKISKAEADSYGRKKAANAGMAKAAWIDATQQATGRTMKTRIPQWIKRHVGSNHGRGYMRKSGISAEAHLQNNLNYISYTQKGRDFTSALRQGRTNALKMMMRQIDHATRSAQ